MMLGRLWTLTTAIDKASLHRAFIPALGFAFVASAETLLCVGAIDKMATDGTFDNMSKRERLQVMRQREKLEKNLGTIAELTRLPAAVFVVDILKEHIAVAEAKKLNIPTFAMVDTNSDPTLVDFPIPANDDATKSIEKVLDVLIEAIQEGLNDRKIDKEKKDAEKKAEAAKAEAATKQQSQDEEASAGAVEGEDTMKNLRKTFAGIFGDIN